MNTSHKIQFARLEMSVIHTESVRDKAHQLWKLNPIQASALL